MERCPFCDGTPGESIETREMMFGLRHPFVYRRCVECGSLWLPEPPADLSPYYREGYYSLKPPQVRMIPAARYATRVLLRTPGAARLAGKRGFPIYLRWFEGLGVSLSSCIADVGSGEGSLVARMAMHGFEDVWGFDPYVQGERDEGAAHIRRSRIAGHGKFDLVMFNHSLEHVERPVEALREAVSCLASDGAIIVRIPIAGSFADRRYGGNWIALDPPRHLAVPSIAGMKRAAELVALKITRTFFDSLPSQIWGSEQYATDIALFEDGSHRGKPDDRASRQRARELNRRGEGDYAGFVLRPT
jgi:SAM-dependent methyltransferase